MTKRVHSQCFKWNTNENDFKSIESAKYEMKSLVTACRYKKIKQYQDYIQTENDLLPTTTIKGDVNLIDQRVMGYFDESDYGDSREKLSKCLFPQLTSNGPLMENSGWFTEYATSTFRATQSYFSVMIVLARKILTLQFSSIDMYNGNDLKCSFGNLGTWKQMQYFYL